MSQQNFHLKSKTEFYWLQQEITGSIDVNVQTKHVKLGSLQFLYFIWFFIVFYMISESNLEIACISNDEEALC